MIHERRVHRLHLHKRIRSMRGGYIVYIKESDQSTRHPNYKKHKINADWTTLSSMRGGYIVYMKGSDRINLNSSRRSKTIQSAIFCSSGMPVTCPATGHHQSLRINTNITWHLQTHFQYYITCLRHKEHPQNTSHDTHTSPPIFFYTHPENNPDPETLQKQLLEEKKHE